MSSCRGPGGEELMLVDLNRAHEGETFFAFDPLRAVGRKVRTAACTTTFA